MLGGVLGVALLVVLGGVVLCAPAGSANESIAAPASESTSAERVQSLVDFIVYPSSQVKTASNRSRRKLRIKSRATGVNDQ